MTTKELSAACGFAPAVEAETREIAGIFTGDLLSWGIFFRLWSISYVYSEFVVHHLPIAAVAAGVIALAAGMFFVEDGEG